MNTPTVWQSLVVDAPKKRVAMPLDPTMQTSTKMVLATEEMARVGGRIEEWEIACFFP